MRAKSVYGGQYTAPLLHLGRNTTAVRVELYNLQNGLGGESNQYQLRMPFNIHTHARCQTLGVESGDPGYILPYRRYAAL